MEEYVLRFEEKTTQPWFTYFQIAGKYSQSLKTNPLKFDKVSISSTRAYSQKYCVTMKYRWIWINFLAKAHL